MKERTKKGLPKMTNKQLEVWHKTIVTPSIKARLAIENKNYVRVKKHIVEQLSKGDLEIVDSILKHKLEKDRESTISKPSVSIKEIIELGKNIQQAIKKMS